MLFKMSLGENVLQVNLNERVADAVFSECMFHVLDTLKRIQANNQAKAQYNSHANVQEGAKKSASCETSTSYNRLKNIKQEEAKELTDRPKRLVVTKCPECGRLLTVFLSGNTITCKCGHAIEFTNDELIDGSYECHHCGDGKGKFKVLGQIDSVTCVKCKGGILLDYDTRTNSYKQVY